MRTETVSRSCEWQVLKVSSNVACHLVLASSLQEQNFATFADDVGGSERLFKTPIPLSYTRLTSRFLVLYHLFLPFALWDALNWLTIPVTIIHTAVFFCIEEVGVLIENPFPVLALDVIAQSARNNVAVSPCLPSLHPHFLESPSRETFLCTLAH